MFDNVKERKQTFTMLVIKEEKLIDDIIEGKAYNYVSVLSPLQN